MVRQQVAPTHSAVHCRGVLLVEVSADPHVTPPTSGPARAVIRRCSTSRRYRTTPLLARKTARCTARVSAGPLAPEASPTSAATAAAATALHRAKSKPNPPPPPPPPPPPRPEAGGCELRLNCAEKCIPSPRSCELSLPPPLTWPPSSPSPAMAKPHELPLRSASHIASISDTSVAMETRTEAKRTHQSQCCTIFSASSKF